MLNLNWSLRFYSDIDIFAWFESSAVELLPCYTLLPPGILRSDFFRVAVLYKEGGVYADVDIECRKNIDALVAEVEESGCEVGLVRDHPVHERVHYGGRCMPMNDFIIARPGAHFLEKVIERVVWRAHSNLDKNDAVLLTGPGLFADVIEAAGGFAAVGAKELQWTSVHPLPDLTVRTRSIGDYKTRILLGDWESEWNPFVVHYWYHGWVSGENMLRKYWRNLLLDDRDLFVRSLHHEWQRSGLQWKESANATLSFIEAIERSDEACVEVTMPASLAQLNPLVADMLRILRALLDVWDVVVEAKENATAFAGLIIAVRCKDTKQIHDNRVGCLSIQYEVNIITVEWVAPQLPTVGTQMHVLEDGAGASLQSNGAIKPLTRQMLIEQGVKSLCGWEREFVTSGGRELCIAYGIISILHNIGGWLVCKAGLMELHQNRHEMEKIGCVVLTGNRYDSVFGNITGLFTQKDNPLWAAWRWQMLEAAMDSGAVNVENSFSDALLWVSKMGNQKWVPVIIGNTWNIRGNLDTETQAEQHTITRRMIERKEGDN